jgi:hypothetical protein
MKKERAMRKKSSKKRSSSSSSVNVYNRIIGKDDFLVKYIDVLDDLENFDYEYYYKQDDDHNYIKDKKGKYILGWEGERKLEALKEKAKDLRKKLLLRLVRQFCMIHNCVAEQGLEKAEDFLRLVEEIAKNK